MQRIKMILSEDDWWKNLLIWLAEKNDNQEEISKYFPLFEMFYYLILG